MNIAEICVKRPVFTTMLMALMIVFGIFSYFNLGVDLLPDVDYPIVTIKAYMPGSSPDDMETEVAKQLEEAVNTISGIDMLRSVCTEGSVTVLIRFVMEKNGDIAVQEVRDKVNNILKDLPIGMAMPVISKIDPSAQPIMTVVVSGDRDMVELTEFTKKQIKESIETVYGVGEIEVNGAHERAINVFIDKNKLEQFNFAINEIKSSIIAQNLEIPLGKITQDFVEYGVRALGRLRNVKEFNSMIIKWINNYSIKLSNVGYAEDSEEEPRTLSRFNGIPSISLIIKKQAGTNTINVVDNVNKQISKLKKTLPVDIKIDIVADQSRFIRGSINEVELHLVLGGILASLIVFLFMGNLRATLIAAISIPISIIATFTLMQYMNFTLNNITLLGLVLSVGIVIDDAIVILENIFRTMNEKDIDPKTAAIEGTSEIYLAVMATTVSLIVIFLPVAFMAGMIGRMFQSYGITVAFAIAVSLVVSFTSTPMLCSIFFKKSLKHEDSETFINKFLNAVYKKMVIWSLDNKLTIIVISIFVLYLIIPLGNLIGKDFMPQDDTSEIEVAIVTPPDWSLAKTNKIFKELENKIKQIKGVESLLTNIGSYDSGNVAQGKIYVTIEDITKRKYPLKQTMKKIRELLADYKEIKTGVQVGGITNVGSSGSATGGSRVTPFSISISGPDLDVIEKSVNKMVEELSKIKGFVDVESTGDLPKPEIRLEINRENMAELGFQVSDIVSVLKIMIGGEKISRFKENDQQYDIILRFNEKDRNIPELMKDIKIKNKSGILIPLSTFVSFERNISPARIERFNRERQIGVISDLDDTVISLNEALTRANKVFENLNLPPVYKINSFGQSRLMGETIYNFMLAFGLSFILMYIVLASQFESFLHPITILLTLPLSLPFALISLIIAGEPLNIYSIFGIFMLFGIVKKNAILQIDYTNTLIEKYGYKLRDAIITANVTRLRPILMTTFTLIAGMLPIALGQGPGAAARASMAKVIIGGQLLCLLLTLLVVPVAYYLFAVASEKLKAKFNL